MRWVCWLMLVGCVAPTSEVAQEVAPAWEGTLVLLEEVGPPVLTSLEVPSGSSAQVYALASSTFAYEFAIEETSGAVALSFTDAPREGESGFDRSGIYVGAALGGPLEHVACEDAPGVWCSYPAWDGPGHLWFAASGDREGIGVRAARVNVVTGEEELEIAWATELAVDPTGEHLVWVAVDPEDGSRRLVLGDRSGRAVRTLVGTGAHADLGLPVFSADGSHVYYVGMASAQTTYLGWLDWLVPQARAHGDHNQPGDWWRVSLAAGAPERLTSLETIHHDGRVVAPGVLAVATAEGVHQVEVSTGRVTQVMARRTVRALERFDPR